MCYSDFIWQSIFGEFVVRLILKIVLFAGYVVIDVCLGYGQKYVSRYSSCSAGSVRKKPAEKVFVEIRGFIIAGAE